MDLAEIVQEKLTIPYADEDVEDKKGPRLGKRRGKFQVCSFVCLFVCLFTNLAVSKVTLKSQVL